MPANLTLKAVAGSINSDGDATKQTIGVPKDTKVFLQVDSVKPLESIQWFAVDDSGTESILTVEEASTPDATDTAASAFVTFDGTPLTIRAKNKKGDSSNDLRIEEGAEGDEEDPGKVTELAIGEYDGQFAVVSLLLLTALAAGVLFIIGQATQLVGFDVLAEKVAKAAEIGSWQERSATLAGLIGLAIGTVVIIGGVWMGALETRGRLRGTVKLPSPESTGGRGVEDVLKGVTAILKEAKNIRATVLVLVAGIAIIAGSMFLASGCQCEVPDPDPSGSASSSGT